MKFIRVNIFRLIYTEITNLEQEYLNLILKIMDILSSQKKCPRYYAKYSSPAANKNVRILFSRL